MLQRVPCFLEDFLFLQLYFGFLGFELPIFEFQRPGNIREYFLINKKIFETKKKIVNASHTCWRKKDFGLAASSIKRGRGDSDSLTTKNRET